MIFGHEFTKFGAYGTHIIVGKTKFFCIASLVLFFLGVGSHSNSFAQTNNCFARVESSGVVYDMIQEAVDNAASGDTIKVAGNCVGNVEIDEDNANLILLGGYASDNWTDRDIQTNRTVVDADGGPRGFLISRTGNVTISGFWITNASRGIATYQASDFTIESNYIHDMVNGTSGTDARYSSGININASVDEEVRNITIRNNVIWNITAGIGYGISVGRNYKTMRNLIILNNTIYNVTDDGLQVAQPNQAHTPLDGAIIYNNVVVKARSSAVEVFNNAVNVQVDHNCTDNSSSYHISGPNDVFGDPLFVDIANADFRLQANSPCLDVGMNTELPDDIEGVSRPQGTAYDIGAYERMEHCSNENNNLVESASAPLSVAVKLEPVQVESIPMSMIVFVLFFIGAHSTHTVVEKRRESIE